MCARYCWISLSGPETDELLKVALLNMLRSLAAVAIHAMRTKAERAASNTVDRVEDKIVRRNATLQIKDSIALFRLI